MTIALFDPDTMARLAAGRWTASYGPGAVVLELVRRHGIARVLRHAPRIARAVEARGQEQRQERAAA